jgi:hypothetical protein
MHKTIRNIKLLCDKTDYGKRIMDLVEPDILGSISKRFTGSWFIMVSNIQILHFSTFKADFDRCVKNTFLVTKVRAFYAGKFFLPYKIDLDCYAKSGFLVEFIVSKKALTVLQCMYVKR